MKKTETYVFAAVGVLILGGLAFVFLKPATGSSTTVVARTAATPTGQAQALAAAQGNQTAQDILAATGAATQAASIATSIAGLFGGGDTGAGDDSSDDDTGA